MLGTGVFESKLSIQFSDDPHPGVAIAALMKLSFDEEHRHAMCQLGALQAIASLIQVLYHTILLLHSILSCISRSL